MDEPWKHSARDKGDEPLPEGQIQCSNLEEQLRHNKQILKGCKRILLHGDSFYLGLGMELSGGAHVSLV